MQNWNPGAAQEGQPGWQQAAAGAGAANAALLAAAHNPMMPGFQPAPVSYPPGFGLNHHHQKQQQLYAFQPPVPPLAPPPPPAQTAAAPEPPQQPTPPASQQHSVRTVGCLESWRYQLDAALPQPDNPGVGAQLVMQHVMMSLAQCERARSSAPAVDRDAHHLWLDEIVPSFQKAAGRRLDPVFLGHPKGLAPMLTILLKDKVKLRVLGGRVAVVRPDGQPGATPEGARLVGIHGQQPQPRLVGLHGPNPQQQQQQQQQQQEAGGERGETVVAAAVLPVVDDRSRSEWSFGGGGQQVMYKQQQQQQQQQQRKDADDEDDAALLRGLEDTPEPAAKRRREVYRPIEYPIARPVPPAGHAMHAPPPLAHLPGAQQLQQVRRGARSWRWG